MLETYATNSFVSFFLNKLHDESNTFLPHRSLNVNNAQQPKTNQKNCIPEDGNYNASFSILSPHNNQPANKRKSVNPSPKNDFIFKSSPKDTYNNPQFRNNNKPRNVAVLTASGPSFSSPKFQTPTQSTVFQSKLNSKPSLFDFIQSPTAPAKTPTDITNTRSNEMIEDFKNRFYMHQNNLQNCNQLEQQQPLVNVTPNNKIDIVEIRSKVLKSVDQFSASKITVLAKLFAELFSSKIIH